MTRHPTARRVHHDQDGTDDAFIARLLELTAWCKAHSSLLTGLALALVVAVAAGVYYGNYRSTLRAQAAIELSQVRQTALSGNYELAARDLDAFINRFGSTASADEARLLLAQLHLENGKPAEAAAAVAELAADASAPLGAQSAFLLAAAHEAAGEVEKAESVYLRVAEHAALGYQRQEALDSAAQLRLERGDATRAVELYEQLLSTLSEDHPERTVFEMRLAEARATTQS